MKKLQLIIGCALLFSLSASAESRSRKIVELLTSAGAQAACTMNFCVLKIENLECLVQQKPEESRCEMIDALTGRSLQLHQTEAAELLGAIGQLEKSSTCDLLTCHQKLPALTCTLDGQPGSELCLLP